MQIDDITVKAADGTTDVVYNALTGAAADTQPALWRVNASSNVPVYRPTLSFATRFNGPRDSRSFSITTKRPVYDGTTMKLIGSIPITTSGALPLTLDPAEIAEAVHQHGNILVDALIRASLEAGYAPTGGV